MKFTIIHGHPNYDIESARLISDRLNFLNGYAEILTDQEFINRSRTDNFIISVGGPYVNSISRHIQSLYGRVIDLSLYPIKGSNNFFGTQNGYRFDGTYGLKGCIAFWGEQWEQTMNHTNDFISHSSILDDIISQSAKWTKLLHSQDSINSQIHNNSGKVFIDKVKEVFQPDRSVSWGPEYKPGVFPEFCSGCNRNQPTMNLRKDGTYGHYRIITYCSICGRKLSETSHTESYPPYSD